MWSRIEETLGKREGKELEFVTRVVIINQVLMAKLNFYLALWPPLDQVLKEI
eukprot:c34790_g1_i1 orf=26-181(-)